MSGLKEIVDFVDSLFNSDNRGSSSRKKRQNKRKERSKKKKDISQEKINNLHQEIENLEQKNEKQVDQVKSNLENKLKRERKRYEQQLNSQEREYQKSLKKQKENFSDNLDSLEDRVNNRIESQNKMFKNRLQNHRYELENMLQQESTRLENYIQQIEQELNSRYQEKDEITKKWLDYFKEMMERIENNYDYQKFAADKYSALKEKLELSKNNYNNNFHELGTIQNYYLEARKLKNSLRLLTLEWEDRLAEAEDVVEIAREILEENRTIKQEYQQDNGGKVEIDLDIEYWSKGEWANLENRLEDYETKLQNPKKLKTEELENIIQEVNELIVRIEGATDKAILRHDSHILAKEIQESIYHALEDIAFEVKANIYKNADEREGNVMILENDMGEQIVTTIEFDEQDSQNKFELAFNTEDKYTREESLNQITNFISQELGIDINEDQIQAKEGYEDQPAPEELFDESYYKQLGSK